MSAKAVIPLALAMVLGLVAALLVRNAMSHKATASVPASNGVSVVAAKQDIEPGRELTALDLTVVKVPADSAPGQVFSDPAQLVGRVVTTQLVKGQTILETLLAPAGTGGGLQALVPPGMRAMTMEVTEYSAVGGMIRPGCHVDIISILHDEKTGAQIARTVLQNIQITAIGHSVTPTPVAQADGSPPPPSNTNAVTLLCTPQQAQMLQLALMAGRPWFVLRSTRDGKELPIEGTTMAELRGDDASQAVAEAAPAPAPMVNSTIPTQAVVPAVSDTPPAVTKRIVQILRGGNESQVTFVTPVPRGIRVETDTTETDISIPDLAPSTH